MNDERRGDEAELGAGFDIVIEERLSCATCGAPLGFDPEDDPVGDAGQPICGECDRSRNFVALEEQGLYDER